VGRIYPKVQLILSAINLSWTLVGRIYPKVQLIFSRIYLFCTLMGRIYIVPKGTVNFVCY